MLQARYLPHLIISINEEILYMQKINVIGGSGFIGTRLVQRLRSNEQLSVQISDKAQSKAHPDLVTLSDV
jgi:GlcNAc-P-P-Und epimerase